MVSAHNPQTQDINPATGLPLIDDAYVDVGGSPYGQDIYQPTWQPQPVYEPNWPAGGLDPW